ncbi:MAG: Tryptophanyl-tRNA synthetase (EC [uncultured Campylobacterales bacterium]|uniref:Tryptophan--tRNA ligase n=1 Tax=uncultured Campylobacterales bacterium TaxID=352960 RepID=A0A6S6SDT9_9BACT|nr:MAG: Tryptophanyl-tRNA synthetase (EC [uncultured Campylobacterales bacterium]
MKKILSGIQASGTSHIGNYFGMIKPMIDMQANNDLFAFIANYHAVTSLNENISEHTMNMAINFLALGLNPDKCTFWVQSDVKEVLELYWILSAYTPFGLLERAHSFKDKVAKGIPANHALFSYPVLMAADILLYDANIIPVGKDQIQHIEMTRDIAIKYNNKFDNTFVLPEFQVDSNVATVPGVDGAKMSKSYNNTIELFMSPKELKKRVMSIQTDSIPLDKPKEYKECNVYNISKLFMNEDELELLRDRYRSGTEGYGHFKLSLLESITNYFEPFYEKREYYLKHTDDVRDILKSGATKASSIAKNKMNTIREQIGLIY